MSRGQVSLELLLVILGLLAFLAVSLSALQVVSSSYAIASDRVGHELASTRLFSAIESSTTLSAGSVLRQRLFLPSNASLILRGTSLFWNYGGGNYSVLLPRNVSGLPVNLSQGDYELVVASGTPIGLSFVPTDTSRT